MMKNATSLGAALFGWPLIASAQEADRGTWTSVLENDTFGGSDSNYTNGFKGLYSTPRDGAPGWLGRWARGSRLFPEGAEYAASYALGQNMFTSSDIEDPNPPLDDRPYAGWLYGEISLIGDNGKRLHSLKLNVGVVGPASLAEETQTGWHDLFEWTEPQVWDTQLENEPALLAAYERRWRLRHREVGPLDLELMPTLGVTVGNVYTYAGVGTNFRLGKNVPRDYGVARVQPGSPGAGSFEADRFGWYVFGGFEGRAIAQNIFLDGNTFRESRSVDKKTLVADGQVGLAFVFPKARIAYTHVFRTKEFETQDTADDFGALSISVKF